MIRHMMTHCSGSNQTDGDLEGQEVEEILIKQEQQQGWANANGLSNLSWNGTNNGRPNGYHINRNGSLHSNYSYESYNESLYE